MGRVGGWDQNGLIAAAWGALYKLTSDLTQIGKIVKLVLKSPKGSVQLRSITITITITYQKRFKDFEILPKFSETRVFRGTIRYP